MACEIEYSKSLTLNSPVTMQRFLFSHRVRSTHNFTLRNYIALNIIGDKPFSVPSVQEEFAVTAKQKGYTNPHWLKKKYIQLLKEVGYDIDLKPDEVPVQVVKKKNERPKGEKSDDESDEKEIIVDYYNVEQTTHPEIFTKEWVQSSRWTFAGKSTLPRDIHGQTFQPHIRVILRLHMVKRGTKSNKWVSEDQLKYFPTAKPHEGATPIKFAGLQHGLYNLSDFRNKETGTNPVGQWLYKKTNTAYSAVTGKPYAKHCQPVLQAVARKRGYKHRHWVTASQMSKFVPPLKLKPNQKGVSLKMVDGKTGKKSEVIAYNQKQLVQPRIVTVHINRLIGKTRFRQGKNTIVALNVAEATDEEIKDALVSYGHIYQIQRTRPHIVMVNFIADSSAKEVLEKAQGMTIGRAQGVSFNKPTNKADRACKTMLLTGTCPIKDRCRFNHDEEHIESVRKMLQDRKNNPSFRSTGGRRTEDADQYAQSGQTSGEPAWNRGSGWGRGRSGGAPGAGWGQARGRGGWGQPAQSTGHGGWGQPSQGGWGQSSQGGWGQASRGGWGQGSSARGQASAARGGWGRGQ